MRKNPIQPHCQPPQISELQFWSCICQNPSPYKRNSDTIVKIKSRGCTLVKYIEERIEQHTVFQFLKAEINRIQLLCTKISVKKFNQLSKLHLQFEAFFTCSRATPLLCTKANLYEHIQKK